MAERLLPAKKWMSKEKHRGFCWRLLAQCALANGWTENQAEYLLAAWRHQHGFNFHDVELASALNTALEATTAVREKYRLEKNRKMEDKTSYRVLEFLATGEFTPAEVARGLSMDRVTIKQCLYRLAKAGRIQKLGGGRYSTVTPTVTQEVKEKKRKVKNSYLSLTKTVTSALLLLCRFNRAKPRKTLTNSCRPLPSCPMKNGICAKSATSSGQMALLRSIRLMRLPWSRTRSRSSKTTLTGGKRIWTPLVVPAQKPLGVGRFVRYCSR